MRTDEELLKLYDNRHNAQSKEYFEKFALDILAFFFPEKFANMTKGECPDYYNDLVGLEVTRGITKDEGNIESLFHQYSMKSFNEIPQKTLERLGFIGNPIFTGNKLYFQRSTKNNGTLYYAKNLKTGKLDLLLHFWSITTNWDNHKTLINSINEKTKKLERHYTCKKENDLAILLPEQLGFVGCEKEVKTSFAEELIKEIQGQFVTSETMFNTIYIILWDTLFEYDTKKERISFKDITTEDLILLGYALSDAEQDRIKKLLGMH